MVNTYFSLTYDLLKLAARMACVVKVGTRVHFNLTSPARNGLK